jgi:hypothetical protein
MGDPMANKQYILSNYVDAIGEDPKKAIIDPSQMPPPPPDPKMLELEQKQAYDGAKLELEEMMMRSNIDVNQSIITLNIAKAEAAELGSQLDPYMARIDQLHDHATKLYEHAEGVMSQMKPNSQEPAGAGGEEPQNADNGAGISGMEAQPSDGGVLQVPEGVPALTGNVSNPATDGRLNADGSGGA